MSRWPKEDEDRLRALLGKGLSASEISRAMGGKYTRCSVIGKWHRLGLQTQITPSNRAARVTIPDQRCLTSHVKPVIYADFPTDSQYGAVSATMALTKHTCRWPIGSPSDPGFHYCGKACPSDKTYCKQHADEAYLESPSVVRDEARLARVASFFTRYDK